MSGSPGVIAIVPLNPMTGRFRCWTLQWQYALYFVADFPLQSTSNTEQVQLDSRFVNITNPFFVNQAAIH